MSEAEVTSGTCATCQVPASLKCSGCSSVFYCGKEHQKQDWVQHKTQCRAFEISTSTELGRHLVACRDIKEGEVILTEDPFVLAPQRVVEYPTCIGCCVKISPTSKTVCPGCTWPACDEKCPKLKDPAFHGRQECTMLSFEASRNRYDWEVVLSMRVFDMHLQKRNAKISEWIQERGPFAEARQIMRITDVESFGYIESSRCGIITSLAENFKNSHGPTPYQCGAVSETCSLDLDGPRNGSLRGLYPNASLMQHSCAPNTRLLFDKPVSTSIAERKGSFAVGRITVKAVRNIRKGEKLSWTCTTQSDTTIERQKDLAARRNMRCFCERCKDPTEFGTNFDTWKCTSCSGWVNLATSLLPEVKYKCNKCQMISDYPVNRDKVILLFTPEVTNVFKLKNTDLMMYGIPRLENLLEKAENYVHRGNSFRFSLKLDILKAYRQIAYFNSVKDLDDLNLQKIEEFGREILGTMENFGNCFFRDEAQMSDCLFILTEAEVEIMKRNFKSGKWSRDETVVALEKLKSNLKRAMELENFVQQFPLRDDRIELISMKIKDLYNWEKNWLEKIVVSPTGNKEEECEHRCATCKKPASLKCSGCLLVYYCDKNHQKENWSQHKGWCRGFEVRTSLELGPHLLATRDFKKDDVILSENPFLVGPPLLEDVSDICVGCCRSLDPVTKAVCPRCKWPVCNSRCPGLKSSKKHAAECDVLSRYPQSNWLPEPLLIKMNKCLLAIRCLLLRKVNPEKWKWIEKMFSFAESKIVNPLLRIKGDSLLPLVIRTEDLRVPLDLLLKVLAVLDVYSLSWSCGKTRVVSALSTNASLLQQSCCPNTRVRYVDPPEISNAVKGGSVDGQITVTALKDISRGEVLKCMWPHQLSTYLQRQVELLYMKNMKCACPRCIDPRELGTDYATLKCTVCSEWVLPIEPCSELTDWKCLKCGKILPGLVVGGRLSYLGNEVGKLSDLDRAGQAVDMNQVRLLQSLLNTYLHPNHQFCFSLKTVMMRHTGNSLGWAGIPKLRDEDLETKAELCRQLIESAEKLGISFNRSETLFASLLATFAKYRAEILKRKFARGEVTEEEAAKSAVECRAVLRRALKLISLPNVVDVAELGEGSASKLYVSEDVAILTWANGNGLKLAVN